MQSALHVVNGKRTKPAFYVTWKMFMMKSDPEKAFTPICYNSLHLPIYLVQRPAAFL